MLFLMLTCITATGQDKKYVCTPADAQTEIGFQGKLFSLRVTNKCLNLARLERKATWSWRVHTYNITGAEGVRATDCNDLNTVSVGEPAVWLESEKVLIHYSSLPKSTFKCEIAP